jgi:hypothetical protein
MTRPIYEPNLERRDAELGFGSDQLFRRPAGDPYPPYPWVRRNREYTVADLTVPDQASTTIIHDGVSGSTDPVYTDYFTATSSSVTTLLVTGVYSVTALYQWESNFTADTWLLLDDGLNNATPFYSRSDTSIGTGEIHMTWRHRWKAATTLQLRVWQESGVNQDLEYGYTEIAYLGAYTGLDPDDDDPQM